jgi:hypothetical protein
MKLVNMTAAIRGSEGMKLTAKLKAIIRENRLKNSEDESR